MVMEPTRLISTHSTTPRAKVADPGSTATDGLMRLSQNGDRDLISGGDNDATQRFTSEIKYVSHFASRLLQTLGMRHLVFGVVEDREGQTAFARFGSQHADWNGFSSSNRRAIKQIREQLSLS